MTFSSCGDDSDSGQLKVDMMATWIESEWMPKHPEIEWMIVDMDDEPLEMPVLNKFTDEMVLADGYRFQGQVRSDATLFPFLTQLHGAHPYKHLGTFMYQFERAGQVVDVLVMSTYTTDDYTNTRNIACLPTSFLGVWDAFNKACEAFAYPPDHVRVVGGSTRTIKTNATLDHIILSPDLKKQIVSDIDIFFEQGAAVYQEMNLNPFRKILLAGVPGTGKTMLCNAIANRMLEKKYMVIYISSSQRGMGETDGANFWKIQQGLHMAAHAQRPTLIILEEFDAYIKAEEKALILNVLDGAEGVTNPYGTLLLATTNYPEAIDERILKRPGRLDRIYVVPPIEDLAQAEAMLKLYLRQLWHTEHAQIAAEMVGYPGSFVREVVLYAVTQMVERGERTLDYIALEKSLRDLQAQIENRDELVKANQNGQAVH